MAKSSPAVNKKTQKKLAPTKSPKSTLKTNAPLSSKDILEKAGKLKNAKGTPVKSPTKKVTEKPKTPPDTESDNSSSEDEKPKASQVKSSLAKAESDDSDSDSDSSTSKIDTAFFDFDEADLSKPTKKEKPLGNVGAGKAAVASMEQDKTESSEESSEDDAEDSPSAGIKNVSGDDSEESGSESESEDVENFVSHGKRKAQEEPAAAPKKVKLTNGDAAPAQNSEESHSIFVGKLSWNVDGDWLKQEFADCGEVTSATVSTDRNTGRSRGFGYVHFTSADAVQKALLKSGQEIDGRAINVDVATPPNKSQARENRAKAFGDVPGSPSSTLFVGNLSFSVVEDTLWEFFSTFGDVKQVRLPHDPETGRIKGFGYVEFSDIEFAKKAYEGAQGQEIEGRTIRIDYSQARDGSGGGRGNSFGGGRGRGGDRGRGFGGDRGRGFGGGRGRGGDRGFRGGRGGDRGGRGRGGARGGRGGARSGAIAAYEGNKKTF